MHVWNGYLCIFFYRSIHLVGASIARYVFHLIGTYEFTLTSILNNSYMFI